jgi:hypothetical protein
MILEAAVELVKALAWPITVLVLVGLFRSEFRSVVARLSRVKYRDVEATFERELEAIEAEVEAIPGPKVRASSAAVDEDRVMRLAAISPRASITEAWREVELATMDAARAQDIDVSGHIAGTRIVRQFVQRGLVNQNVLPIYDRLRRLRNSAAHSHDFQLDADEAQRYASLAIELARGLHELAGSNT